MTMTMTDQIALEDVKGLRGVISIDVGTTGKGKIYLEGHDISHLVRSINMTSGVGEATTVTIELIGIEIRS